MFKFSLNRLKNFCNNISLEEVLKILDLQGFEVKNKNSYNSDTIITIEVKANRPDMLSHIGIAREIQAFKRDKISSVYEFHANINNDSFPININIQNSKTYQNPQQEYLNHLLKYPYLPPENLSTNNDLF